MFIHTYAVSPSLSVLSLFSHSASFHERRADIYSRGFPAIARYICIIIQNEKKGPYLFFLILYSFSFLSFASTWIYWHWLFVCLFFLLFLLPLYVVCVSPRVFPSSYFRNYSDPRKVWRPALLPYYLLCAGCFVYYVYHELFLFSFFSLSKHQPKPKTEQQQLQKQQPNNPCKTNTSLKTRKYKAKWVGRCIFVVVVCFEKCLRP